MSTEQQNICPVERAGSLETPLRKLVQNPKKILEPYITKEMIILDVGCGPGFFSIEMAKMLNENGKVIAADVQEGMLEKIRKKIQNTALEQKIELHQCKRDKIGLNRKVDFVLAFYMVHEVPDQDLFFDELASLLVPDGKLLVIEPKFHVTEKAFAKMLKRLNQRVFEILEEPKVFFSRAVLIRRK